MRKLTVVLFPLLLALPFACSEDGGTGPEPSRSGLYDSQGEPADQLDGGQSAYWQFADLQPRTQYDVTLKDDMGTDVAIARLTTDPDGKIPLTAIGFDLGLGIGGVGGTGGSFVPSQGTYTLDIFDLAGSVVASYVFTVDATTPMVFAADQQGDGINSFLRAQHPVYARGVNLTPGETIDLYVVDDVRFWSEDMALVDVSGGAETVTVDGNGEFLQQVWASPSLVAPYDIVADRDRNGSLGIKEDLVDGYLPVGFMVQVLGTGADIQVQIACDANRDYKDIFEATENVYAVLNPRTQQFTHKWVHKYVVVHQDQWNDGDPLTDVTEGPEYDTPQYGCTNEGRVLIWPATLVPGKYDIVIDVNRDGIYTQGMDFLDNIDSYGLPTAGFIVAGEGAPPVVMITSPEDGLETSDRVVYLTGTVSDTSVTNARLIVNGGAQTIGVVGGQMDYTSIVLQRGWNTIRVEAHNEGGLGHDEVQVNGTFDAVGMNVNMAWNKGPHSDVDLWVEDATGEWCGWTNRNTAIGGWLDVDDTEGWGPENFYLSQAALDSTPGDYHVAVHYWDDAGEGPTIPTIRVLLNEGQANQIERTIVGPTLNQEGEWWYATTITMPAGTFSDFEGPGPFPAGRAPRDLPKKQ
jgi:uncharacterized protein YfaP (DUF2135 family)